MSASALETFLARLYTDAAFLALFLRDPGAALAKSGLTESEARSLAQMDRASLLLAVHCFGRKRASRWGRPGRWRLKSAHRARQWAAYLKTVLRRWVVGPPRWRRPPVSEPVLSAAPRHRSPESAS